MCIEDLRVLARGDIDWDSYLDGEGQADRKYILHSRLLRNHNLHSLKVAVRDTGGNALSHLRDVIQSCPNLRVFHAESLGPNDVRENAGLPYTLTYSNHKRFPPLEEVMLEGYSFYDERQASLWNWSSLRILCLKNVRLDYFFTTVVAQRFDNLRVLKFIGYCHAATKSLTRQWRVVKGFFGCLGALIELSLAGIDDTGRKAAYIEALGDRGRSLEKLEFVDQESVARSKPSDAYDNEHITSSITAWLQQCRGFKSLSIGLLRPTGHVSKLSNEVSSQPQLSSSAPESVSSKTQTIPER